MVHSKPFIKIIGILLLIQGCRKLFYGGGLSKNVDHGWSKTKNFKIILAKIL